MASTLSEKDRELLQIKGSKTLDFTDPKFSYLGQRFSEDSRDFVEVYIYDTNENFIESSVVDSVDYELDTDDTVKLKTGTILRKLGYDRGRYVVKYKFLRKLAGDYQNVLVYADGTIFNPPEGVDSNENGNVAIDPNGEMFERTTHKQLFLREYKYFIHEISPSRKEIRLATQEIHNERYLQDFFYLQKQKKKVASTGDTTSIIKFNSNNSKEGESLIMELPPEQTFLPQMVGGEIRLNGAFLHSYIAKQASTENTGNIETRLEEIESGDEFQANFYISNIQAAEHKSGDLHFVKILETFKDGKLPTDMTGVYRDLSKNKLPGNVSYESISAITNLDEDFLKPPVFQYRRDFDKKPVIVLKSNSIKPDTATTYHWIFGGYDKDDSARNHYYGTAWKAVTNQDLDILNTDADPNTPLEFKADNEAGRTVKIRLRSKDCHYHVKLRITNQNNQENTLHLPACIETTS